MVRMTGSVALRLGVPLRTQGWHGVDAFKPDATWRVIADVSVTGWVSGFPVATISLAKLAKRPCSDDHSASSRASRCFPRTRLSSSLEFLLALRSRRECRSMCWAPSVGGDGVTTRGSALSKRSCSPARRSAGWHAGTGWLIACCSPGVDKRARGDWAEMLRLLLFPSRSHL